MTLAYYAVPPRNPNRPLGRLKENKRGKRRGSLGGGWTAGPSKEAARGPWPLALRGKPPASRVGTPQPSAARHSPRRGDRVGETRTRPTSQSPPWNRPAPSSGPRCRNSPGREEESGSQPFFIRCNRPRKNSGPGSRVTGGTGHRRTVLKPFRRPAPHPYCPRAPRRAPHPAPRPAPP